MTTAPSTNDPPAPNRYRLLVAGQWVEYAAPFECHFPALADEQLAELEESARARGRFELPAVVTTTPTWGRTIVDGVHRAKVAEKTGAFLNVFVLDAMGDEEAGVLADILNAHRRQLTPEQLREARSRLAAAKAAAGESVRRIAEDLGVGRSTVERDLLDAQTGEQVSHRGTPGGPTGAAGLGPQPDGSRRVAGADGKVYRVAPRAAAPDPPADGEIRRRAEAVDAGRLVRRYGAFSEDLHAQLRGPHGDALADALARYGVADQWAAVRSALCEYVAFVRGR